MTERPFGNGPFIRKLSDFEVPDRRFLRLTSGEQWAIEACFYGHIDPALYEGEVPADIVVNVRALAAEGGFERIYLRRARNSNSDEMLVWGVKLKPARHYLIAQWSPSGAEPISMEAMMRQRRKYMLKLASIMVLVFAATLAVMYFVLLRITTPSTPEIRSNTSLLIVSGCVGVALSYAGFRKLMERLRR